MGELFLIVSAGLLNILKISCQFALHSVSSIMSSLVSLFSCDLLTTEMALHFVRCYELVCVNSMLYFCNAETCNTSTVWILRGKKSHTFSFKAKSTEFLNAMSSHKVAPFC